MGYDDDDNDDYNDNNIYNTTKTTYEKTTHFHLGCM